MINCVNNLKKIVKKFLAIMRFLIAVNSIKNIKFDSRSSVN